MLLALSHPTQLLPGSRDAWPVRMKGSAWASRGAQGACEPEPREDLRSEQPEAELGSDSSEAWKREVYVPGPPRTWPRCRGHRDVLVPLFEEKEGGPQGSQEARGHVSRSAREHAGGHSWWGCEMSGRKLITVKGWRLRPELSGAQGGRAAFSREVSASDLPPRYPEMLVK
ncbi:uncharacterized protein LOC115301440 isoform X12 [Suricata suricatta]|uniref:uncharacterized protein LOC115301440 isoform X12 n=1 Tax=Suricata suricatta TaxID=37032 RepID=UPI001155DEFC|nr:uncharacterized protein LOC115301440 isoform X12 [Suricata suricatta]